MFFARRAGFAARATGFGRASCTLLPSVPPSCAFFVNIGREISGLAQLADRLIRGIGFNQPGDSWPRASRAT